MRKCPACGSSIESGIKFCTDCGAEIPQEKECPRCKALVSMEKKFCEACGYSFCAKEGSMIGDKSVVSGDVTIDNSTTEHIVNNTNNISTVHNYINNDETKRLVDCVVCGRKIPILKARACRECHKYVCLDHYNSETGTCHSCEATKEHEREAAYAKAVDELLSDGIIDREEFDSLELLRQKLGLSAAKAIEIQKNQKKLRLEKISALKGDAPLMTVESAQYDRAEEIFYNLGEGREAVKILESIYKNHSLNEKVLSLYLSALSSYDKERVKSIIATLPIDIVQSYLLQYDFEVQENDIVSAEIKLSKAEELWPANTLVKCRRAELLYITAIQSDNQTYLVEAMNLITSLDEPKDKLGKSWQFYIQNLISQALGDVNTLLTEKEADKKGLYYAVATGKMRNVKVLNVETIFNECLVQRNFEKASFKALKKIEFNILNNAFNHGDAKASLILGDCYYSKDGCEVTIRDYQKAFLCYKIAAEKNIPEARYAYAYFSENGIGCTTNLDVAIENYTYAKNKGVKSANQKLEELKKKEFEYCLFLTVKKGILAYCDTYKNISCFSNNCDLKKLLKNSYVAGFNIDEASLTIMDATGHVVFEENLSKNYPVSLNFNHNVTESGNNSEAVAILAERPLYANEPLEIKKTFSCVGLFNPKNLTISGWKLSYGPYKDKPLSLFNTIKYKNDAIINKSAISSHLKEDVKNRSLWVRINGDLKNFALGTESEVSKNVLRQYRLELSVPCLLDLRQIKFDNIEQFEMWRTTFDYYTDKREWGPVSEYFRKRFVGDMTHDYYSEVMSRHNLSADNIIDEVPIVSGAEFSIYDEDDKCIFKKSFKGDSSDQLTSKFLGNFEIDTEIEGKHIHLYVCNKLTVDAATTNFISEEEFDASKLQVSYKTLLSHIEKNLDFENECKLLASVEYDGIRLIDEDNASDFYCIRSHETTHLAWLASKEIPYFPVNLWLPIYSKAYEKLFQQDLHDLVFDWFGCPRQIEERRARIAFDRKFRAVNNLYWTLAIIGIILAAIILFYILWGIFIALAFMIRHWIISLIIIIALIIIIIRNE